jgi:transposase, IS5 family
MPAHPPVSSCCLPRRYPAILMTATRLAASSRQPRRLTGCEVERAYVDKGYRGHDAANPHRVFISGQKRGVIGVIKRELRRRSAIEAVIGHMKSDGHLGRCHLKGQQGDAANVILTAVGHNLRLVLAWLRILLRLIVAALCRACAVPPALRWVS